MGVSAGNPLEYATEEGEDEDALLNSMREIAQEISSLVKKDEESLGGAYSFQGFLNNVMSPQFPSAIDNNETQSPRYQSSKSPNRPSRPCRAT